MALDAKVYGSASNNGAEVDSTNNLKVTLPQTANQAGFALLAGRLSASADPAGLIQEAIRSSTQGRLSVGQPVVLFNENFQATALNSALYTLPVTNYVIASSGGTLQLNSTNITTLSSVARLSTYAHFPLQIDAALYCVTHALINNVPQINTTIEFGFGIATALTAPTDGAFFRFDASGNFRGVSSFGGVESQTSILTAPSAGLMHEYKIVLENDRTLFYIDGACVATLAAPTDAAQPTFSLALPYFARQYNAASAPSLANNLRIGSIWVALQDAATLGKDNATVAAAAGRVGAQGQTGQTMGSTALLTNNLAAGAGVAPTNTTAALGSGLGGQFAALPTLAVGTDGIISSFQNPAPTSVIPGKMLYIRGVRVQGVVTTILTGGPVIYEYALCFGHTAVSLATLEAATTKAPRRIPIGIEVFAATAAVGTVGSPGGQYMAFAAPIPVNPGEFVQVSAKNLGTVTTLGVILLAVSFDSYWE